jgi:steroid delta-isomerase-like uncharacterized protein
MSDLQERNKEAVRRFFQEIWCDHDEAAIDRYIAEDAAGNDPDFGIGRESFRKQWKKWLIGFPDLCLSVEELVAEGDTVVSRWTLTGTHTGPFLGVDPTGKTVKVSGMSLDHLKDGVVVAGCDGWDALGFRQQLGIIPPDPKE